MQAGGWGSHSFADAEVVRSLRELLAEMRLLVNRMPLSAEMRRRGSSG